MEKNIICPKCTSQTNPIELEPGLTINRCLECSGVWLDQGELSQLGGVSEGVFRWDAAMKSGSETDCECPSCHQKDIKLYEVKYSFEEGKIKVDLCRNCRGVWLDQGELPVFLEMLRHLRIKFKKN